MVVGRTYATGTNGVGAYANAYASPYNTPQLTMGSQDYPGYEYEAADPQYSYNTPDYSFTPDTFERSNSFSGHYPREYPRDRSETTPPPRLPRRPTYPPDYAGSDQFPPGLEGPPDAYPPGYASSDQFPPGLEGAPDAYPPGYAGSDQFPPGLEGAPDAYPPGYPGMDQFPPGLEGAPDAYPPGYAGSDRFPPRLEGPPDGYPPGYPGTDQFPPELESQFGPPGSVLYPQPGNDVWMGNNPNPWPQNSSPIIYPPATNNPFLNNGDTGAPPENDPFAKPQLTEPLGQKTILFGDGHVMESDGGQYDFKQSGIYSLLSDSAENVDLRGNFEKGPQDTTQIKEIGLVLKDKTIQIKADGGIQINNADAIVPASNTTLAEATPLDLGNGNQITRNGDKLTITTANYSMVIDIHQKVDALEYLNVSIEATKPEKINDGTLKPGGLLGSTLDMDTQAKTEPGTETEISAFKKQSLTGAT